MHILSSLLFALSANADNFVVGLSYGIKKIRIGLPSNFLIALISLLGTILSMSLGKVIYQFIPEHMSNIIGSILLILLGSWTIIKPLLKGEDPNDILENPEKADKDNSLYIDVKESVTLAFALTINNIGLGIGASVTGLNIALTSVLTFMFSLLMIIMGYFLGSSFSSKEFNHRATIVSGLIIIALGIYEMLI